MDILTLDTETYYDKDFSLSKLTMEHYIRDPRFEVIMLGIRWPDGTKEIVTGSHEEVQYRLDGIEWGKYAVLCHNTLFDAAILAWRFGVNPAAWLDTLSMARAMFGMKGNSLALLARRYGLEDKGTAVQNAMGKRRCDFTEQEFKDYADYCLHDVQLCHELFFLMSNGWYKPETFDHRDPYPRKELELIDRLIRMYTEPTLRLNAQKLEEHLADVVRRKEELLTKAGIAKEDLMSNPKFALVLESFGVSPPMKISATTGKQAFAFAKTDPGMKALLEHPDDRVQAVVAARMGVKSTLEETRTQRFIDMAQRNPLFPVPLRYSAARTHRLGGTDGINLQNLPARGAQANKLKKCIEAPLGHVIIDCDSSNIEARMLAWLAGQDDLVQDFANGVDVYCKMASKIFGRPITKADKVERFVGKTVVLGCLAEGTLVLCERGWVPIQHVTTEDRVWDGLTWVAHQGLLKKGSKETWNLFGLWLTPDHQVLCGTEWKDAQSVLQDESSLCQILDTGAANLPSQATSPGQIGEYQTSSSNATAADLSTPSHITISRISKALGVTFAHLKSLTTPIGKAIGFTLMPWRMTHTESVYSIGYPQLYRGATTKLTEPILPTEVGGSLFVSSGEMTSGIFSGMYKSYPDGITPILKWTAQITTKATNLGTYGLSLVEKTLRTEERSRLCSQESKNLRRKSQTYDLALAGPRNRFTVLTERGPIIVHNCGYQTGAVKLQITLKASEMNMDLELNECKNIIDTYRNSVPAITRLWRTGDSAIEAMHRNTSMWFGREGVALVEGNKGIKLPSGLYISYPQLHRGVKNKNGQAFEAWQYKDETGLVDIYGGKLVENVVQALARIVVMQQLLKISKKLHVVLTVHDAVAAIAREEEAEQAQAYVEECMRWVPKWAAGCPINCESGIGRTYGDC
jgi:DNA polymerase I-like protein with 3'-5' exonuclease and polymerase domains